MRRISRPSPWYTYGGSTISPAHPPRSAARASATASSVESAEIPATTGMPLADRLHAGPQDGDLLVRA